MNENVVDILIYLYENYMDVEQALRPEQDDLHEELAQVGFRESTIRKAFQWLNDLAWQQGALEYRQHGPQSMRIYTARETARLDIECRSLLLFLEQSEILDQISRELVIERVAALDGPPIGVEELKWVVLLVLMNQPGQEAAFARMEDLVYNQTPLYLH